MRHGVLVSLLLSLFLAGGMPLTVSCRDSDDPSDVSAALERESLVTYVRYTNLSPTYWPTRTEAWLDGGNERSRSWSIMATDSAVNPFVWTAIRDSERLYPSLPALLTMDAADDALAFYSVPLRTGSEVRMGWPVFGDVSTFTLVGEPSQSDGDEWGVRVRKYRWAVSPDEETQAFVEEQLCGGDSEEVGYFYEYATDLDDVPVAERLLADCDGEEIGFGGIIYHEVVFLDRDDLPDDFFDPEAVSDELIVDQISAFTTHFGTPYWLGPEVGPYVLANVEPCRSREACLELSYWPEDFEDTTYPELSLLVGGYARACDNEQSLEPDVPGAKLCPDSGQVVWDPPDFHVSLGGESDGVGLPRDELIAIARELRPYDGPVISDRPPIMTMEEVRELVGDWLDMVCPDQWTTIRQYRDSAVFDYDETAGEWRGKFGPVEEWAVTDPGKPVAWPVAARELVAQQGGSFPPGYAKCSFEAEGESAEPEGTPQLTEPGEALRPLKAYRYRERVVNDYLGADENDSVNYFEGSFLAPDRAEVKWWPTVGGVPSETAIASVIIRNRTWVDRGDGWQESPSTSVATDFGPADHLDYLLLDLGGIEPTSETVNGVRSLRYDLAVGDVEDVGFISLLTAVIHRSSPDLEAHLWLAEEGSWPVRLVLSAPADDEDDRLIDFEYSMDIFDVNDPGISIEPPTP